MVANIETISPAKYVRHNLVKYNQDDAFSLSHFMLTSGT